MAKKLTSPKSGKAPSTVCRQLDAEKANRAEDSGSQLADFGASMIVSEILLRSAGRMTRHTLEKAVARRRFDPAKAKAIVENRSIAHTMIAYGITKLATRSVPGALLVGGGLLAKTLFDRGGERRKLRKSAKSTASTKSAD
jgi:hypothetical protein